MGIWNKLEIAQVKCRKCDKGPCFCSVHEITSDQRYIHNLWYWFCDQFAELLEIHIQICCCINNMHRIMHQVILPTMINWLLQYYKWSFQDHFNATTPRKNFTLSTKKICWKTQKKDFTKTIKYYSPHLVGMINASTHINYH